MAFIADHPFIFLAFPLVGYLSGSFPFALWITRWVKGVDVRSAGSKHATTTNTIRQAGWAPGILVFVMDVAKGYLPVFFVVKLDAPIIIVALTGGLAVVGHCWPLFAGFRGGMGLATAGGTLLAVAPLALAIGLGLLIALTLGLHHSARAGAISGLMLMPVLWVFGQRGEILWLASVIGFVLAGRFLSDWDREYRELWLDRG